MCSPHVETEGGVCCRDWRRSQWTLRGQRTDLWHSTAGQGEDLTDLPAKVWFPLHTAVQGYRNWLVDSLFITLSVLIISWNFHRVKACGAYLCCQQTVSVASRTTHSTNSFLISLFFVVHSQNMRRKESLSCYRKSMRPQRFEVMLPCWTP